MSSHNPRPHHSDRVYDTRFCHRCECEREFSKRRLAHRTHLLLTIATLGLWGVSWAAVAIIDHRRPWRCSMCGSRHVRGAGMAPPTLPSRPLSPISPPKPRSPAAGRRRSWE